MKDLKILTFDIEDWFHLLNNPFTENPNNWKNFESRIHLNMDKIFNLLSSRNTKATFFCLGWIAEKYPDIIKEISKRGFDIGTHSFYHQLTYKLDRRTFKEDIYKSISVLEDLTGKKVISFRAPSFSITNESLWAYEILYDLGIRIDSSIFPANRSFGGVENFKYANPFLINLNGNFIKEFPISKTRFFGKDIIYSGGGYFRVFPYKLTKRFSKQKYIMSYFHPRDFDHRQPMIKNLSLTNKFKSYVGLKTCLRKLNCWISDFDFVDLNEAEKNIEWKNVNQYKI